MVQMNKDGRVWVSFEMVRVQTVHAVQRLWPNRWPVRRVPAILEMLKNYRKYRQYGTSLSKQWHISLGFSYIVIKGQDKKLWFHFAIVFCSKFLSDFEKLGLKI